MCSSSSLRISTIVDVRSVRMSSVFWGESAPLSGVRDVDELSGEKGVLTMLAGGIVPSKVIFCFLSASMRGESGEL